MSLKIVREVNVPDPVKLARYRSAPGLGPGILFFSGGSALRELSRTLIEYTHNSIHLITPFDSGGSSAELRKAFGMPAVGDLRNRLMALADQSIQGNREIFDLFTHRFPREGKAETLPEELDAMAGGTHHLVARIPDPIRKIITRHLRVFCERMPPSFDLRGASIGNLVLAAGYLESGRDLDPVLCIYSRLAEVRGTVRQIVNASLHLVAELENGERLVGQHLLTGKSQSPIESRVARIYLTDDPLSCREVRPAADGETGEMIRRADLICFPVGSFYSSLVCNLLPAGVGRAVGEAKCPKVFVPNTAPDPECYGLSVSGQVKRLVEYLRRDDPQNLTPRDVCEFVLLDAEGSRYPGGVDHRFIRSLGLVPATFELVSEASAPCIDPVRTAEILLSLA
jgi:CofD-related protein of GAK system